MTLVSDSCIMSWSVGESFGCFLAFLFFLLLGASSSSSSSSSSYSSSSSSSSSTTFLLFLVVLEVGLGFTGGWGFLGDGFFLTSTGSSSTCSSGSGDSSGWSSWGSSSITSSSTTLGGAGISFLAGAGGVVAYLLFLVTEGFESFYVLIVSTIVINSSSILFFGSTFSAGFSYF